MDGTIVSGAAAWRRCPSGWWTRDGATFSRWRRAQIRHRCEECRHGISPGEVYVEQRCTRWFEYWPAFFSVALCPAHQEDYRVKWYPPEAVAS
jgi:hypothetical protein